MRRVGITGFGAVTPVGMNAQTNWEALKEGRSGIGPVTLFDSANYACRIAGEVSEYQAKDHFSVKELRRYDRFIQFALLAGREAMAHSGLDMEKEEATRVGSCVGVGIGGLPEIQNQYEEILNRGPRRVTPFFIPMIIPNLAAGQLAIQYGFKGPNTCITTACSSSAHALGESMRLIQRGEVDAMVSGGAEAVICELGFAGFCAARALSTRNGEPLRASRPFDKERDGFVMGEGAAILVLEELEHAKKRGATIYAELVGYGLNCDANHITQPAPDGEGARRCMQLALDDAKLEASKLDYINAHGTSTPIGDVMETMAIKAICGDHAKDVAVSSTKSMTGHLLGAAGAAEAMYCVQALQHQVVPPTVNLESPDDECDLNYIPGEPQKRPLHYALTNSFGFGGTNATLILKKADA